MAAYNATHDQISINLSKAEFDQIHNNLWITQTFLEFIENQKVEVKFDENILNVLLFLAKDASDQGHKTVRT